MVCGLVYDKDRRKRLRVVLNSPMSEYIKFIRHDTGIARPKIKTFVGYQARSLIIGVNDKWVYKFPLRRDNYRQLAVCEERILNALAPISPIYAPPVQLLDWRDMIVRKYAFVPGVSLRRAPRELIMKNLTHIAAQVANFMYVIGTADPDEIRDLKPRANMRPGYACGWCQGDICDNFMIDLDTMTVTAFIDWEDAAFGDFAWRFDAERRSPAREFMHAVRTEYDRIWHENHPKK